MSLKQEVYEGDPYSDVADQVEPSFHAYAKSGSVKGSVAYAKQVISTIQNVIGIIEGAEEPDRTASGTFHDGDLLLNLKGLRLKSEEKQTALNLNFLRVKITEDLDDAKKKIIQLNLKLCSLEENYPIEAKEKKGQHQDNMAEYYVTLVSIHKLAKDNNAFDESICYFFNQDLNLKNVLRIGNHYGGLYYFSDKDSVTKKVDTTSNVFQELNHINFFDNEYPEIPNDDERVDPSLNSKDSSQSDSSCEPKPFLEASKHTHWTDAMNTKMKALRRNDTWELTHLPKDRKSIDFGKLKYLLGIEVIDTKEGICLNQRKYCLDLLSEFGILACNPSIIPLPSKLVISYKPTDDDPLIDNVTEHQKLMGKLIYLTNTTHDISYGLYYLSKFMHSRLVSHSKITFKILRYLKGSPDFFDLWKLGLPLDAVVEGLMLNMQNEGSIYTIRTCYAVTLVHGYAVIMLMWASFS
ncbi:ribonuclease H-like domain-containing protein [Tanacetum coccineum]